MSCEEFNSARAGLEGKIRDLGPHAVAFLGKRAFAEIGGTEEIGWGLQPAPFAGAQAWVLPNPSGLNRGFTLEDLVAAYRDLRTAIGISLDATGNDQDYVRGESSNPWQ